MNRSTYMPHAYRRYGISVWILTLFSLVLTASGFRAGSTPTALAVTTAGFRDFSYSASGVNEPTAHKPQSKLWFNDGIWWGSLFNTASDAFTIYSFDRASNTWSNTGTVIDTRNNSKADILWDGTHLYIASAGGSSTSSTDSGRLLRYSYNTSTKRYTLDPNFPVTITTNGMEAIVLDKDTTGQLWVTYTQGSKVLVNRSIGSDQTWGTPFTPAVSGTTVAADDISAVIRFNSRIGIMWSNQVDDAMYFAIHRDVDADNVWQPSQKALQGPKSTDDHINLKSLEADSTGRVFAAVKTSLNDASTNPNTEVILLLAFKAGAWSKHVFGRASDDQTRPVVMLDEQHGQLYLFATTQVGGGTINSGTAETAIYYKQTDMNVPNFAPGKGTPFIESTTDRKINNVTSTKQNLNGTTDLVMLASDNVSKVYLHNTIELGAPVDGQAPTAPSSLAATAASSSQVNLSWTAGTDNVGVTANDIYRAPAGSTAFTKIASVGAVTSYSDTTAAASTAYDYQVKARDGAGNVSGASNTATVTTPAGGGLTTLTFDPQADAYVAEGTPTTNFGTATLLGVDASPNKESYLRFAVSGVTGTVQSAKLRVNASNGTTGTVEVYPTSNTWTETGTAGITWNSRPARTGAAIASKGPITLNTSVEFNVTSAVTADGTYSFILDTASTDGTEVSSREGTNIALRPQLVLTVESASTPDTTAPTVTSVAPADGATDVTVGANVQATFSEAMAAATIDSSTFTLTKQGATTGVGAAVTFDGASKTATLTPNVSLDAGATYTASVKGGASGAKDVAGNSLAADKVWSFTTAAAPVDGQAPTAPSSLAATAASSSQVNLSWTAGTDNVGVTANDIYRAPAGSTAFTKIASVGAVTSYSDTTAAASTAYDYQVKARDGAGNVSGASNTATVTTPAGGGLTTLTFDPQADAWVKALSPSSNFGAGTILGVDASSAEQSYLRFAVSGVTGTVQSAKLRLRSAANGTADGPAISTTSNTWTETGTAGITWNNRPAATSAARDDKGAIGANIVVEYDVTPFVAADGTYSFVLTSSSSDGVEFNSREATTVSNRPQLVLTMSTP